MQNIHADYRIDRIATLEPLLISQGSGALAVERQWDRGKMPTVMTSLFTIAAGSLAVTLRFPGSFTTGLRALWNSNVGWGHTIAADFNADGKADLTSRYHKVASGGRAMSFRL